jgi:siroheme synthase-like protein
MYPIFLDLRDRLGVVIGGGSVGRRKAAGLLEGGARVRLVCLEPRPPDAAPAIDWRTEVYHAAILDGADLVFAAATAEVNRQVVVDARSKKLWVNAADDPLDSDFLVPAVLRRGDFLVAVSTGGASPTLAQNIRDQLAGQFDEAYGRWAAVLAELRPEIVAQVGDPAERRTVLEMLARTAWLERLRSEKSEAVERDMRAEIRRLVERGKNRV